METISIDQALVRRLIAAQFPQWARLPLEPVTSAGTDNAIFRLGDHLTVRAPRMRWAVGQAEKEQRWLPRLAPLLPLPVPAPVARGAPAEGYPWAWTVCQWLDGQAIDLGRLTSEREFAADLAGFVTALHRIDPMGGPLPGPHNFHRGLPLNVRDAPTRAAIAEVSGMLDAQALAVAWDTALAAPTWRGAPVWIHGDLQAGNLLSRDGRLSAVIDFGGLGLGDPACDLIVAWNLMTSDGRAAFRSHMACDAATWARGRGWALSTALIALPYYLESNPAVARNARRTIDEVLADRIE